MAADGGRGPVSLIVPLYNEEERLDESFDALVTFVGDSGDGSELIFVDDGSRDRTADLVENRLASLNGLSVRLVRRPHEGKGASIRAGLELAECDYAGFCDVDLSTPLEDPGASWRAHTQAAAANTQLPIDSDFVEGP